MRFIQVILRHVFVSKHMFDACLSNTLLSISLVLYQLGLVMRIFSVFHSGSLHISNSSPF
jgi:hypothetical protein